MTDFKTCGKVLTITVGLPACGKTTFAETAGFDVNVSLDDCREALWGDKRIQDGPGGLDALLDMQDKWIESAMKENRSLLVHNTNILEKYRRPLIEMAKRYSYRTQIVYFNVPLEECIKRNKERPDSVPVSVIESFDQLMEKPGAGEADLVIDYGKLRNEAIF